MTNEEYNKWIILYFDMQSINLQFNCNDITSIGTELVAQLLYFLQQRNYITEEQMNDACNEILKSN